MLKTINNEQTAMSKKTPEHILERNRQYRKKVKYHLKRDKKKQAGYVKKSQKKHADRVRKYHRNWTANKKAEMLIDSNPDQFMNSCYPNPFN